MSPTSLFVGFDCIDLGANEKPHKVAGLWRRLGVCVRFGFGAQLLNRLFEDLPS
ncbi:MAG: hypothetical protein ACJAX2_000746 [Celeribacter sp.]|jgi:hypothetical protein